MVNNSNDIITFLQTHKDEMAQRFGVVSVGLFGSWWCMGHMTQPS